MQTVKNTSGRIKDYLSYFLKTRFKFNIHSPFVYDFVDQVLEDFQHYKEYDVVDAVREKYMDSKEKISKTDYGSGAKKKKKPRKHKTTIGKIIRNSSLEPKEGKLLFRMVRYYKPEYLLELGTSLGISTFYQGLGAREQQINSFITIEGCPNVYEKALSIRKEVAQEVPVLDKITYLQGPFEQKLEEAIESMPRLDWVVFDGDHTGHANLQYFYKCLEKVHEDSIFIIDDIYHSRKMKKVWETVKINPKVRTTVDLFNLGIVFFNNPYAKQNFTIRF